MMRLRTALVSSLFMLLAAPASAVEWNVRLEGAAAGALENPQRRLFSGGGDVALRASIAPVGFFELQLSGAFLGLRASDVNPSGDTGTAYSIGAGIRFKRPWKTDRIVSPWIDADGSYVRTGGLDRFGYSVGAGVAFAVDGKRMVRIGPFVRYFQVIEPGRDGFDTTDLKALMGGISIEVGRAPVGGMAGDRDGDGIPDAEDKCPSQAEDRDGFEDQDGCPDLDNDRDGIPDAVDKCPNQAEDKDGFEDQDGCPDPDNDGDGIPDAVDKCPNQAEDRDGFQDQDGCPDPDNDKDGVLDADDKCPNLAGPAETGGCPDRDGDLTNDDIDQCPDVPGPAENHGCPIYKDVKVTENKVEIAQKIFFAFDQSRILPKSFPLLDQVVQALKDHKALHVRIEGHTDAKGSAEHNRILSNGRANAVRDYLVGHGIAIDRLDAKGYGPDLPLESNKTAEGREHNRRVEFVIVRDEGAK